MYVSGMNPYFGFFFATTTLIIAVPDRDQGLQLGAHAVARQHPADGPNLFAIGFIFTFVHGGLTGLFLGNVTRRPAAVRHVLRGGALPHGHGRLTGDGGVRRDLSLVPEDHGPDADDASATSTSGSRSSAPTRSIFPMHYLGILGMPRRYYALRQHSVHPDSAHAAERLHHRRRAVVATAQLIFLFNVVWSLRNGRAGGPNPWSATTLEWQTPADAAGARQLGTEAAGRLSLGLRLQRAGRGEGLRSAERAAEAISVAR